MTRGLDLNTMKSLWSFEGAHTCARTSQLPVVIAAGKHLFPFRTEKLSPPAPLVIGGQPPGRVGRRRLSFEGPPSAALRRSGETCADGERIPGGAPRGVRDPARPRRRERLQR